MTTHWVAQDGLTGCCHVSPLELPGTERLVSERNRMSVDCLLDLPPFPWAEGTRPEAGQLYAYLIRGQHNNAVAKWWERSWNAAADSLSRAAACVTMNHEQGLELAQRRHDQLVTDLIRLAGEIETSNPEIARKVRAIVAGKAAQP